MATDCALNGHIPNENGECSFCGAPIGSAMFDSSASKLATLRARIASLESHAAYLEARVVEVERLAEHRLNSLTTCQRERSQAEQRIADLEAERAALMEAGKVLAESWGIHDEYLNIDAAVAASEIFDGKPGALAAWLAREGR